MHTMIHARKLLPLLLTALFTLPLGCATAPEKKTPTPLELATAENNMLRVEMAERTRALLDATDHLNTLESDIDEQRRRT